MAVPETFVAASYSGHSAGFWNLRWHYRSKKICDLACAYEAGVQIHVCGSPIITAASLHMECAIPNFVIHEYNVNTMMPNMLALGVYDYQPVDGKYTVPDLPGIGNEISDTAYRNSTIATIE